VRAVRRHDSSRVVVRLITTAIALALAMTLHACSSRASASLTVSHRFFGMHVPTLGTSFPASLSGSVGAVNLSSDGVYWPDLETSDGVYDWTHLDAIVDQARSHGAQPLLVLGQTPSWAGPSYAGVPPTTAWQDFVRTVVMRYGTRLDYQIWPEPNISQNWSGTPAQIATLTIAAAKIIHAVAPKAVVVSPAMVTRLQYQRAFMNKFFAAKVGGKRVGSFINAVGLDLYPLESGTPEDSMVLLRKARAILRSHRVTAPVWNVEINYGVISGGQTTARPMPASQQASYVVRTYVLNAAAGVRRVYWLGWGHWFNVSITMAASDGSPTRAGVAFHSAVTWLNGQKVHPCVHNTKRRLYSCQLVKHGSASWVYWTTKGKTVVRAPKGSRFLQTVSGARKRTHTGKRLTATTSPIWVYH
jgi:polysaccharide biosynthesis protein PslG